VGGAGVGEVVPPPLPVTGVRGVVTVLVTRPLTSAGPFGEPSPVAVLAPVEELLVVALTPRPEPPKFHEQESGKTKETRRAVSAVHRSMHWSTEVDYARGGFGI